MREILRGIHANRGQCEILMHNMRLVDKILYLADTEELQIARFEALLQHSYEYNSADHQDAGILQYMFKVKDSFGLFFLLMANHLTRFIFRDGQPHQPFYQRI